MQEHRPGRYRILYVGAPSPTAPALAALLAEHGYVVEPAADTESAFSAIQRVQPDLIALDVDPTDTGVCAFCSQLKADAAIAEIPILCVLPQRDSQASTGSLRPELQTM